MNIFTPGNALAQIWADVKNFATSAYPSFVTGGGGETPEEIPVFSFHDVVPEKLGGQLQYLADNGYATVTSGEYFARGGKTKGERVVMLTFDDGRASLWNVAHPLLKKHGMRAVAFISPGEILEAVSARTPTMSTAVGDGDVLCSWPEIAAMREVVDFQSHSLYHWMMFTGPEVACFFTPKIRDNWARIDLPIPRRDGKDILERDYPLGAPLYQMDSRLSGKPRMIEPETARSALAGHVARNGGEAFFERRRWNDELLSVHRDAVKGADFRYETAEDISIAMSQAVEESKRIIESRLPGHAVNGFCCPFGIGGSAAVTAVASAGYDIMYWGVKVPAGAVAITGMIDTTRVKDDFILRLPGKGRRSLFNTLAGKALRRAGLGT
jgi:hypothetical protein